MKLHSAVPNPDVFWYKCVLNGTGTRKWVPKKFFQHFAHAYFNSKTSILIIKILIKLQ